MWPSIQEIINLPIERQAQHADQVCGTNARNLSFCRGQIAGFATDPQFHRWNATSIGNLAYMALYGCEETRGEYKKLLDRGIEHFQGERRGLEPRGGRSSAQSCCIM